MPYPGILPSKTKQMERCVSQVMADPKMKKKYPNSKKRKSHAIAICHSAIAGKANVSNIDINISKSKKIDVGKEVENMAKIQKDKKVKGEDLEVKKQDIPEEVKEEAIDESPKEEVAEEKPAEVAEEAEVKEEAVEEVKEEVPAEEKPAEEVVEEKPAEEPIEEKPTEEVKEEVVEAVAKGEDKLSKILDIVAKLEKLVKQDAPVEEVKDEVKEESSGAEPEPEKVVEEVVEKPAEEVVEQPIVEEVKEGVVEEAKEEVVEEKVAVDGGESFQKIEGLISKLSDRFEDLEKRIQAIEEQPAPTKVFSPAVVKKGGVNTEKSGKIEEINAELKKLEDLKNDNIKAYQSGRKWEEAFKLLAEREQLLLGD